MNLRTIRAFFLCISFTGFSSIENAGTRRAISKALPSVVRIEAYNDEGLGIGSAAGFAYRKDGIIVTAAHVISGGKVFLVIMADGDMLPGVFVGKDNAGDVAVLRVYKELRPIRFANSDKAYVGEALFAIGHPLGLFNTVTSGIVCGKSRNIGREYGDYIQTDAKVNPGSSGGPLLNARGRLIGMVVLTVRTPSGAVTGYGLAVPSNRIRATVRVILKNAKITLWD